MNQKTWTVIFNQKLMGFHWDHDQTFKSLSKIFCIFSSRMVERKNKGGHCWKWSYLLSRGYDVYDDEKSSFLFYIYNTVYCLLLCSFFSKLHLDPWVLSQGYKTPISFKTWQKHWDFNYAHLGQRFLDCFTFLKTQRSKVNKIKSSRVYMAGFRTKWS